MGDYFYLNNVKLTGYQVVEFEGDYYFISDGHKLAKNCTLYLSDYFVAGTGLAAGSHNFDADGKIVIKNGPVGDYFYLNNVKLTGYQVVKYDGNYYFIGDGHKLVKNRSMYIIDSYLYKYGLPASTYRFDADGKMILKNGPVDNMFYIDGIRQNAYQLLEFEGYYYFVSDGNRIAKNCTLYMTEAYVYGTGLKAGYYSFDSNGRMIIN